MSYGDYSNRVSGPGGSQIPPEPKGSKFSQFFKNLFSFGSIGSPTTIDDYEDQTADRKVSPNPPPQAAKTDAQFPKSANTQIAEQPAPEAQTELPAKTNEVVSPTPSTGDLATDDIRQLAIEVLLERRPTTDLFYNKKLDYAKVLEVVNNLKPEDFVPFRVENCESACQNVKADLIPKFTQALRMQKIPREQERDIPPVSKVDTFDETGGSIHGQARFIPDDKILQKNEILKTVDIGNIDHPYILVNYTSNNKAILQQQATRGCTAAATGMLLLDKGGKVDLKALTSTNLGTEQSMKAALLKAGFEPIVAQLNKDNYLLQLRNAMKQNGSAIVSVFSWDIGGSHVIVVDDISLNLKKVRLRDPYHGWEITISGETFMGLKPESATIQIKEAP